MKIRYDFNTLPLLVLLGAAAAADAQVQPQLAQRWFEEATKLCERDAGRLWGVSLCGPMVIVDQATGTRATSQPEPEGQPPRFPGFVDGPVSRDAGRLWGVSLCGPMVIVDQATGTRATSQPEPEGQPPRFPGFVDGPVSWGGLRWFSWPLYMLADKTADVRQQIILHGLFHRIQPELGFTPSNGLNEHLDTLEGRVRMQLEW